MKAVSSRTGKALQTGSVIKCADNSGAKLLQIIAVRGYKGIRRKRPAAGVADTVICRVESGTEKVRKQIFKAVVIRQKKEYRRHDGTRIQFEDNAAVLVTDKFEPVATLVKGPVAKEAIERFKIIGKVSSIVV